MANPGDTPNDPNPSDGRVAVNTRTDEALLEDAVPLRDVLRVGGYAAIVVAIITFGIGWMVEAYAKLRPAAKIDLPSDWSWFLAQFSIAAGLVAGALVIGWRLMNRRPNEPRWGMAMLLVWLVVFAVVVWPTPWVARKYDCAILHVNRVTGHERLPRVPTTLCADPNQLATQQPTPK